MRDISIAVFSVIHSNHIALEACIREIEKRRIQHILFLGDYVSNCAYPQKDRVMMFQVIAANYYNYYKSFTQSNIINLHESSVSWIIPCKGEKGPSIAFRIRLNEENAETELKTFIQGIRKGEVPQLWIVTPDASPDNIIDIMEKSGFKNLSDSASEPEPAMALYKQDFVPHNPK